MDTQQGREPGRAASPLGKIRGAFVDFSERTHEDHTLLEWSEQDWTEELADMRAAGIGLAIPARTMRYGRTYYYSRHFETHNERDYLSPFMRAASAVGMTVYLAGMVSDHFFTADDAGFSRMMSRDLWICETLASELLELYGGSTTIGGIYISHEADNDNLARRPRRQAAQEFFGALYQRLKRLGNLTVLSSPFFTKQVSPEQAAGFWDAFLDRPMFDILAMQDGVGCDRDIAPEDLPPYFEAMGRVFRSRGIAFWHNCETFSFNPGFRASHNDRRKIWLHPAPMDRIDRQYRLARPFVEQTITWEFGHFMGRKQVGRDWYDAFRSWNLAS